MTFDRKERILPGAGLDDKVAFLLTGSARASRYPHEDTEHGPGWYDNRRPVLFFHDVNVGDLIGEVSDFPSLPAHYVVSAESTCEIYAVTRADFRSLMEKYPSILDFALGVISDRSKEFGRRLCEIKTMREKTRVYGALLRLVPEDERASDEVWIDKIVDGKPIGHRLAASVDVDREAVGQTLGQLSSLGIAKQRGDKIIVRNLQELISMYARDGGIL